MSTIEQPDVVTYGTRILTTLDGEEREAKTYPDGSYSCPWCGAAVLAPSDERSYGDMIRAFDEGRCPNPCCLNGIYATLATIARTRQERAEREASLAEARRRSESFARYVDATRAAEKRAYAWLKAEAEEGGYCPICIMGYHHKRVRHRTDPEEFHAGRPRVPMALWGVQVP